MTSNMYIDIDTCTHILLHVQILHGHINTRIHEYIHTYTWLHILTYTHTCTADVSKVLIEGLVERLDMSFGSTKDAIHFFRKMAETHETQARSILRQYEDTTKVCVCVCFNVYVCTCMFIYMEIIVY
jgi:hypothetical protein